eukprot:Nk52_evm39s234 gene=Nk52_evmTU39s234
MSGSAMEQKKKDVELIVSDVDGTLLNSKHEFAEETSVAIRKVQEKGIPFVIATGKSRGSVKEILHRANVKTPGIFANGLLIQDADGTILEDNSIPANHVVELIDCCLGMGRSYICYSYDSIYSCIDDEWTQCLHKYHEPDCIVLSDLKDRIINQTVIVHKLLVFHDPPKVQELRRDMEDFLKASNLDSHIDITQAVPESLELMPKGISKASALQKVAKMLSVQIENTVAFGDGQNDQQMLQLAGVGVAMDNASADTKKCANMVTKSNDHHGVAHVLTSFILDD